MKAPTEGKAALEAAIDGMVSAEEWSSFWSREDAGRLFLAGLRAYLGALSDTHRLVRTEDLRGTCCPTGLEDRGNGDIRDCSVCGGDGISPAYKLTPPGLEKEQEHD